MRIQPFRPYVCHEKRFLHIKYLKYKIQVGEDRPDPNWADEVTAAMNGDPDPTYYPDTDEDSQVEQHDTTASDEPEVVNPDPENEALDIELDKREKAIQEQRAGARASQQKQADKMLEESQKRFGLKNTFKTF